MFLTRKIVDVPQVGDVLRFNYKQPVHGGPQRVGLVIKVRDTITEPLSHTYYYRRGDKEFKRTRHLITVKMPNGDIRTFYGPDRMQGIKKYNKVGAWLLRKLLPTMFD